MVERIARPAARILLLDPDNRLLLFRFDAPDRSPFWCTPGGRLDDSESYAAAARRELYEETGFDLDPGPEVARRMAEFIALEGHPVWSDERYFLVRCNSDAICDQGYTELERAVMTSHHWFTQDELANWHETIYPGDIIALLKTAIA
jgi:8-oxo-dGTP diphosphatase